jgi:ABC-type multidrug transport system fused ATPase/permease subunit
MEEVSRRRKVVVLIVVALTFSTAITYFVAAAKESSELQESQSDSLSLPETRTTITEQEQEEEEEEEEEEEQSSAAGSISGPRNETIFFIIIAFAYIGVGIWMLKNRSTIGSRVPYMIAIVGSIALIVFYTATRVVDIPYIGIEEQINPVDILAKCLQAGIVAGSIYVFVSSGKATQKQVQHKG